MDSQTTIGLDVSCILARPLTGVGYSAMHLVRALAGHCPELALRLFASGARTAEPDILPALPGVARHVIRMPNRLKTLLWTRAQWPPMTWWTGPVDVVHGLFHLLPPSRRARRVVTIHDLYGIRCPHMASSAHAYRSHLAMLRNAARRADAIITVSASTKEETIDLLEAPEERCHVIHWGISVDEFTGPLAPGALDALKQRCGIGRDYFLCLGTLEPRKNVPRLVQAYGMLRERRRDCPLLVLGGGAGWQYEEVYKTIETLGLGDSVVCTGYLERPEVITLLRGAHACLYPSLYEGFGLPVLEAMAAGTPVLTSNTTSMPEVAGDTGLLVNPLDIGSIMAGMESLVVDYDAARRRAVAAQARAREFTWARTASMHASLYRALAAGASR